MKIHTFEDNPICNLAFLNAGKGSGTYNVDQLPIHCGQLTSLPEELDAIIATADLQGRERFDRVASAPRLLGEVLPEHLISNVLPELSLTPQRTGVLLAGDFYTVPNLDRRGGSGDVSSVWQAFARTFKWVIGVAGNHDEFGNALSPRNRLAPNAYYLDGEFLEVDGLKIAGIGGIIGNPRKPQRKTDEDFAERLLKLLDANPDVVVMHDGPGDDERAQRGSPMIRHTLESLPETLVIRGHAHWDHPLAQLANGTDVLNVDCRVAILTR